MLGSCDSNIAPSCPHVNSHATSLSSDRESPIDQTSGRYEILTCLSPHLHLPSDAATRSKVPRHNPHPGTTPSRSPWPRPVLSSPPLHELHFRSISADEDSDGPAGACPSRRLGSGSTTTLTVSTKRPKSCKGQQYAIEPFGRSLSRLVCRLSPSPNSLNNCQASAGPLVYTYHSASVPSAQGPRSVHGCPWSKRPGRAIGARPHRAESPDL